MSWKGVMPAITTCFTEDFRIDHGFMAEHCRWLLDNGCSGIVALGSLGEGATLSFDEKLDVLQTCVRAVKRRGPVIASISALTTWEAVALAKAAVDRGCGGLMVLPPYVYKGDWREMKTHMAAVFRATSLPCMLYNNPIAYGTDFLPEQISELAAEHENFEAVKESSTDARRVSAIRALVDRRLEISVGVDDAILEAIGVGATGWVAGLTNALPRESVDLLNLGIQRREPTKLSSCTAGSFPCFAWTRSTTSCSSLSWCKLRWGWAAPGCVRRAWNWSVKSWSKRAQLFGTRCAHARNLWVTYALPDAK